MFARIILACAALLFGLMPATAEELPNLSRVIVCKLIKDDVERLRCYDRALSEAPSDAPSQTVTDTAGTARVIDGSWHVSEGKSATDGTPQLVAALEALGGRAALILRCQHGRTEAYVTLQSYVGAATPLPVTYTINDGTATDTRWLPAQEGNALFVPTPTIAIAFIRSLADQGTLALTVHDFIGRTEQMRFKLGPIAELREKIASSCNWPADIPQAGTTPAPPPAATAGSLSTSRRTSIVGMFPRAIRIRERRIRVSFRPALQRQRIYHQHTSSNGNVPAVALSYIPIPSGQK